MRPCSSESEKEAKRGAIVAAAAEVFASQGFIRTRMADIAAAADVGKGTLYEYFGSKDELFFAVFDDLHRVTITGLREDMEHSGSALETLRRMFATGARIVRQQVEQQAVVLDFWAASRGHLLEQRFRDACIASYAVYRDMTERTLERGQRRGEIRAEVNAAALAVTIVAAFDGLGVQLFFDRDLPVEDTVAALIDSLCKGICED
jgi:AcrR family transcriptional regulator